jgi:hypothetical protein
MAKKIEAVKSDTAYASLADLGFKQAAVNATLQGMAEFALKVFGNSFPSIKRSDKDHAEKIGELTAGYLSYWATLPRNMPTVYIIVEEGQRAIWVPQTDSNKDAKGERVEVTAHTVMAHSQQAFGKFKNGDASAEVMPKSWQPGYHAIAKAIRDRFSTYTSDRFSDLQKTADRLLHPDGKARTRSATADMVIRLKKEQETLLKNCRVAKERGDVTAFPDRLELGFSIFNDIYSGKADIEKIRVKWTLMFKELSAK